MLRTAWLYSRHGRNFVTSLLERMRAGETLEVVADQIGSPTWARGLARVIWQALNRGIAGIHHWTDAGVASWYDFAVTIQDEAQEFGLVTDPVPIRPIAPLVLNMSGVPRLPASVGASLRPGTGRRQGMRGA